MGQSVSIFRKVERGSQNERRDWPPLLLRTQSGGRDWCQEAAEERMILPGEEKFGK